MNPLDVRARKSFCYIFVTPHEFFLFFESTYSVCINIYIRVISYLILFISFFYPASLTLVYKYTIKSYPKNINNAYSVHFFSLILEIYRAPLYSCMIKACDTARIIQRLMVDVGVRENYINALFRAMIMIANCESRLWGLCSAKVLYGIDKL